MKTIAVSLDDARADLLAKLSERVAVEQSMLASSLLSSALDEIEPGLGDAGELLNRIPGADERITAGVEDLQAGRTQPLDAL